jgi:hypothetical protein
MIPQQIIVKHLKDYGIQVTGVLHIGAHDCEEAPFYTNELHVSPQNVLWVDALEFKVEAAKKRGIPNVYQCVVSDKDDEEVTFNIANNNMSSSILEFGTHANHYRDIKYVSKFIASTKTIDTFLASIPESNKLNYWSLDIQGVELKAFQGAIKSLANVMAINTEVSYEELYKGGCRMEEIDLFLAPFGFTRVETRLTNKGWGDALYLKRA